MGVVNPDVGVVRPGVGVVRTEVDASGEDDVQRWEPVSLSNGEDLKYPPFSALVEDLKWPPSMAADRKLPPSVKKEDNNQKSRLTKVKTQRWLTLCWQNLMKVELLKTLSQMDVTNHNQSK